ncbi:MAG: gliding motility-associated C-terminal domain-containing protein [Bacteroidota bacterium]
MPIIRCYVFLLILGSIYSQAYGQVTSPKNRFEVDFVRGCAPLTVTANNIHNPITDGIVWNAEWDGDESNIEVDSDAAPVTFTHTYTEPGSYLLLQVVGNTPGPIDTIRIEVLEPRAPQFNLINCTENRVYVDIQDDFYDLLEIDFGDGTTEDRLTSVPSFVYSYATPGEYTVTVRGVFSDANSDDSNCTDSTATFNTFDGGAFPQATFSEVEVLDEISIRAVYSIPTGGENIAYELQVSENGTGTTQRYPLQPGSSEITVTQEEWNTRENYYCITVAAVDPCSGNNFPSNPLCTIALQATAENLQNNLNWQTEPGLFDQYDIIRDDELLITSVPTNYEDIDVVCKQTYTYQIVADDGVGVSRSEQISLTAINEATPASLTSLQPGLRELAVSLTWVETPEAEQYYIYRRQDGTLARYDSVTTEELILPYVDTDVEIDQEYCYQVSYVDECGNESELSEEVCQRVPAQAQLYFPNAFTPNGDGLNDVFVYRAALVESVTFEVFNRWGELLFQTNQLEAGWDGTYRGGKAPEGTYLYQVQVRDQLGNQFNQRGKFVLLNPNAP